MITYSHAAEVRMEKLEAQGITPEALGITRKQALHHLEPSAKAPNGADEPSDGKEEPCDAQRKDRQKTPEREIVPTPYVPLDPTKIPRRQWLYGKHHVRKFVSATFAPSVAWRANA